MNSFSLNITECLGYYGHHNQIMCYPVCGKGLHDLRLLFVRFNKYTR